MEKTKKIIEETLAAMGIKGGEIEIKKDNSSKNRELLVVNVELPFREAKYFLNEDADGLNSFQYILRLMIFRGGIGQPLLALDINGHKKEREKVLAELAIKAAQKVRRTKKPITLKPMPAYERRFIHLKLAEQPDIVTESTGIEPERKIVVRLYP